MRNEGLIQYSISRLSYKSKIRKNKKKILVRKEGFYRSHNLETLKVTSKQGVWYALVTPALGR